MAQKIKLGKRNVNVYHFTGKVAHTDKDRETLVSGGGGGGGGGFTYQGTGGTAPTYTNPVVSRTYVHDQLFLVDKEGNEKALQLVDFDLACREGHIVTVMWAIIAGKQSGPYFAVINHSTNSQFIKDAAIAGIVKKCVHPLPIHNYVMYGICGYGIIYMLFSTTYRNVAGTVMWILLLAMVGLWLYTKFILRPDADRHFRTSVTYPDVERW